MSRNVSPLAPGRSVEGGNLPIDELMGVKAVDSIDLSERRLGTMSAIIISACIAGNRHLRKLKLSGNELGNEGAKALASVIRDSPSLTSVDVGRNSIGQAASLELLAVMKGKSMVSIGMADCKLGVEGSKVVAEMISVMASVTSVRAFRNSRSSGG